MRAAGRWSRRDRERSVPSRSGRMGRLSRRAVARTSARVVGLAAVNASIVRTSSLAARLRGVALAASRCGDKLRHGRRGADAGTRSRRRSRPSRRRRCSRRSATSTITLGDYAAALEHMDQFDRLRYQSPERRKELLDEMIDVELLAHEADARRATTRIRSRSRSSARSCATRCSPRRARARRRRATSPRPRCARTSTRTRRTTRIPSGAASRSSCSKDEATRERRRSAQAKKARPRRSGASSSARSRSTRRRRPTCPVDLAGDLGIVSPPGDARGENPRVPDGGARRGLRDRRRSDDVLGARREGGDKFYVVRLTQKTDAARAHVRRGRARDPRAALAGQDRATPRRTSSSPSSASSSR